ncbi:hypothetical protein ACFHWS_26945 [Micromonospora sp. LOL_013]|uniref:hypothetical protein n=1 Tax=Micromonospora sp. LOL_013 TaxID=3345414 RepID=UPI003A856D91
MVAKRLYCSIILWNLSQSEQTITSLRGYLRDYAVDAYSQIVGLRQKLWISSTGPEGELWGAVYLWDNEEAAYGRPPAVSRVGELIGYRPTRREYFSVEAAVEGISAVGALMAGLGLAFQEPAVEPFSRPREYVPEPDALVIPTTKGDPGERS